MTDQVAKVKALYDSSPELEWERMDRNPFEFEITKRMLSRYIQPCDSVLDIGGGPGRYSLWLAERGCSVTLAIGSLRCVCRAKGPGAETAADCAVLRRTANRRDGLAPL